MWRTAQKASAVGHRSCDLVGNALLLSALSLWHAGRAYRAIVQCLKRPEVVAHDIVEPMELLLRHRRSLFEYDPGHDRRAGWRRPRTRVRIVAFGILETILYIDLCHR